MDQSIDKKIELREKLVLFYKNNKIKVFITLVVLLILAVLFIIFDIKNRNKNIIISEKYVQASFYLSTNEKVKAKKVFEEVIKSKNKFYSILALSTILEKNLAVDKNEILKYFEMLEKIDYSKDKEDLIKLKKALYLIKIKENEKGSNLLKQLIDSDSTLKKISQEIINK